MSPAQLPESHLTDALANLKQIDAVCEAFEQSWLIGVPCPLHTLLARVDQRLQADLFSELLLIDVAYRTHRGEIPAPADYLPDFAAWESQIDSVFARQSPASETADATENSSAIPPSRLSGETRTISRYRLETLHAEGGLGKIWRATDPDLRRDVALKRLNEDKRPDPIAELRFIREAQITARLEHPGIVPVYGLGSDPDGRSFYVMRLVKGETLRDRIQELHSRSDVWSSGAWLLKFRHLLAHFITVCRTIDYAHSRGLVHRDLKPANILLGEFGEALVLDWGLARPVGSADHIGISSEHDEGQPSQIAGLTGTGAVVGTPYYMSPEQASGSAGAISRRQDIYSLGATLAVLLSGQPPVEGEDPAAVIRNVIQGLLVFPRERLRRIPAGLDAICRKTLQRAPEQRYESAGDLAEDLERWLAGEALSVLPESCLEKLGRWQRRHRTLVASTVMVLITAVVLGAVGLTWMRNSQQRQAHESLIDGLANAELSAVSRILSELSSADAAEVDGLRQRYQQSLETDQAVARRNLCLALLPSHLALVDVALEDLLEAAPDDFRLHASLLDSQSSALASRCRELWPDDGGDDRRQLNLAAALAVFDANHPDWPLRAERVVQRICKEPVSTYSTWRPVFQTVATHLKPSLQSRCDQRDEAASAYSAAEWIALLFADETDFLIERLQRADERQLLPITLALHNQADRAIPLLRDKLRSRMPAFDERREYEPVRKPWIELARRQARAAAALLAMGDLEYTLQELEVAGNPTLNSLLIHLVPSVGIVPDRVAEWWGMERLASRRRTLTLMLGRFSRDHFSPNLLASTVTSLQALEDTEADPALHAAYGWLLRHWQIPVRERIPRPFASTRRWYETRSGETFVIVQGPVEFLMGSPSDEFGRNPDDVLHLRRIPRSFAIADREASQELVRKRLGDYPRHGRPGLNAPGSPAVCLTLFDCARYCRLLSEEEGIPEDQMCFPPIDEIGPSMVLPADYLQRTGYRLPTESEWEFCAKAGTISSTSYGDDPEVASHFAWNAFNSPGSVCPGAGLMPNPLGLFDMHGNAGEWTIERSTVKKSYRENPAWAPVVLDSVIHQRLPLRRAVIVRGGYSSIPPGTLRSTERRELPPEADLHEIGIRPIRTLPADWVPFDAVRLLDSPTSEVRFRITGDGQPFEVTKLSAGIEVKPQRGTTPAEIVVTSPSSDSPRFALEITNLKTGQRRQVSGSLIDIKWSGHIARLTPSQLQPSDPTPELFHRVKKALRSALSPHPVPGEEFHQQGDLRWSPDSGLIGDANTDIPQGWLLAATAQPRLRPGEYFIQVSAHEFLELTSGGRPLFEMPSDASYHAASAGFTTLRVSCWDPDEAWKLTAASTANGKPIWLTLRPVPGLP